MPWRTNVLTTFRTREVLEISDQEVSGSAASDSEVVVRRSCENVEEDVRQAVAALNEDLNEFHGVSFGDD